MSKQILNGTVYGKPRDIRELTQAQYDALSNAEKMNGVLYCIKDNGIVEGEQFAPVIYSTEERMIGTWTDGKPLYQKTVSLTLTNNTSSVLTYEYSHNIADVENIFIVECHNNNGVPVNSPRPHAGNTYEVTVAINSTKDKFYVETGGTDRTSTVLVITVRYTKSTDTPGSGTWLDKGIVPYGVKLWQGTLSGAGEIAIEGLGKWLLLAFVTDYGVRLIGSPWVGGTCWGAHNSTTINQAGYRFDTSTSGKLIVNQYNRGILFDGGSTYAGSSGCKVNGVYGLFKYPNT